VLTAVSAGNKRESRPQGEKRPVSYIEKLGRESKTEGTTSSGRGERPKKKRKPHQLARKKGKKRRKAASQPELVRTETGPWLSKRKKDPLSRKKKGALLSAKGERAAVREKKEVYCGLREDDGGEKKKRICPSPGVEESPFSRETREKEGGGGRRPRSPWERKKNVALRSLSCGQKKRVSRFIGK